LDFSPHRCYASCLALTGSCAGTVRAITAVTLCICACALYRSVCTCVVPHLAVLCYAWIAGSTCMWFYLPACPLAQPVHVLFLLPFPHSSSPTPRAVVLRLMPYSGRASTTLISAQAAGALTLAGLPGAPALPHLVSYLYGGRMHRHYCLPPWFCIRGVFFAVLRAYRYRLLPHCAASLPLFACCACCLAQTARGCLCCCSVLPCRTVITWFIGFTVLGLCSLPAWTIQPHFGCSFTLFHVGWIYAGLLRVTRHCLHMGSDGRWWLLLLRWFWTGFWKCVYRRLLFLPRGAILSIVHFISAITHSPRPAAWRGLDRHAYSRHDILPAAAFTSAVVRFWVRYGTCYFSVEPRGLVYRGAPRPPCSCSVARLVIGNGCCAGFLSAWLSRCTVLPSLPAV